jgi:uncharacterized protein DUF3883
MTIVHRSEGSIERKLRTFLPSLIYWGRSGSTVTNRWRTIRTPWWLPLNTTSDRHRIFFIPRTLTLNDDAVFVAPPSVAGFEKTLTPAVRRLVGKFDPAERDARNRQLGKAGEKFVVEFERDRLRRAGRNDLADDVRWVSDLDGDGYGYDVRSFEPDGQERLLEIKTTCGHERTAFWLSRREVDVAAERSDRYRIRRVFHFRNHAQMFEIAPPLEHALLMTPTTYSAEPRQRSPQSLPGFGVGSPGRPPWGPKT